jgi:mRNA interferase MazF
VARGFVPDSGDIMWLNFTPHAGREQAGHRPALVVSPAIYNDKTSLMICCPLTTRIKNYPFEVARAQSCSEGKGIGGGTSRCARENSRPNWLR